MISSPIQEQAPASPNARYMALIANWKSHICAGLGGVQVFCGLITLISINPFMIVTGVLQVVCGLMVLAVEAASLITPFVPQLKPFAAMFENRPPWQKVALFGGLFFVPFLLGSFGLFLLLGQICALGVAGVYVVIMMGEKADINDMRYQAGAGGQTSQPYSPTSP